ncbi:MAG: transporter [Elusimicrobiaceae bacterium]|nr:transporter [Elusimicrobiaceae bacterium]MBP5616794.1 transporter [Elusimicrobiaceae bacterium]
MKKWMLLAIILGMMLPAQAQLQRKYQYGVEPTDNITSLEFNPTFTAIDDSAGISTTGVTTKMYRVINPNWNWGLELPLTRFESPEKSVNGLGDLTVAVNWMRPESIQGGFGYGAHMEMIVPTATDKRLGAGQVQVGPSVFALYSWESGIFTAVGYKQMISLFGDHARDDINMGRFRYNLSYLSDNKWWFQANLYYYHDFTRSGKMELVPEFEIGTLVNEGTALYANVGTHAAGNMHSKDWSVSVGFKILYL